LDVVRFAIHLHQLRTEVCADLGENVSQVLDRLAVEDAASVFGHEDQMNVQCKNAMSTASKVLAIRHRPECTGTMERPQTFQFELMENGEQRRQMRRYAGSVRFVYNKALTLQNEMYELTGKSHTRFQLDKLLTLWKQETPWLSETHSLQQSLVDLDRAYTTSSTNVPTFRSSRRKVSALRIANQTRRASRSTNKTAAFVCRRLVGCAIATVVKFSV
jgi:hypothetical protein